MLKLKKLGLDVIISLLLAVALIVPAVMNTNVVQVLAEVITGDGYSFDDETGVLTVTSNDGTYGWRQDMYILFSGVPVKKIIVENTVTEIEYLSFRNCTNAEEAELPEGLEIIHSNAFDRDSSLKSISIPSTVTKIYYKAFADCTALETIIMNPVNPPEHEEDVFDGVKFDELGVKIIVPKRSYNAYVEEWPEYADYFDFVSLHDHEWSNEWEMDEDCHWHNCIGEGDCDLTDITEMDEYGDHEYDNESDATCNICGYERTVPDIGGYLFDEETKTLTIDSNAGSKNWRTYGNFAKSAVEKIIVKSTVTELENEAFAGCINLETITMDSAIPPVIASDTFAGLDISKIKIYVPEGSVDTYKEQWPELAESIVVPIVNNNPGAGNTYPVAVMWIPVVMAAACAIIFCVRKKRRFEQ